LRGRKTPRLAWSSTTPNRMPEGSTFESLSAHAPSQGERDNETQGTPKTGDAARRASGTGGETRDEYDGAERQGRAEGRGRRSELLAPKPVEISAPDQPYVIAVVVGE
jgi:hypothetical protein